ncbi:MAG: hypothetical protein ACK5HR_06325 [Mycoplasmatales bacterium]
MKNENITKLETLRDELNNYRFKDFSDIERLQMYKTLDRAQKVLLEELNDLGSDWLIDNLVGDMCNVLNYVVIIDDILDNIEE